MCGFDALMYAVCRKPAARTARPSARPSRRLPSLRREQPPAFRSMNASDIKAINPNERWEFTAPVAPAASAASTAPAWRTSPASIVTFGRTCVNSKLSRPSSHVMRELERHLHAGDVAVVRVVGLHGDLADRRIRVAHRPRQQPGLLIEVQRDDDAVGGVALHDVDVLVVDRRRRADAPPRRDLLDLRREQQHRVDLRARRAPVPRAAARRPAAAAPQYQALRAVVGRRVVAVARVNDDAALQRRGLRVDLGLALVGRLGSVADVGAGRDEAGERGGLLRAADRLDVLVEDLIRHRRERILRDDGVRIGRQQRPVLDGEVGNRARRIGAAMAGPAGHHLAAAEVVLVDLLHHLDHAARHLLPRVVGGKPGPVAIVRHVAVLARHAERRRKEPHRRHELIDGDALSSPGRS